MLVRRRSWALPVGALGVLFTLATLAQACSTSSSASSGACADNPNACGAGTTCWPKDCTCAPGVNCGAANCTPHLACLPSVVGKNPHDSCNNKIGTPTCSDHQACVEIQSGFGGCLLYCNDSQVNRGCPTIETCVDLRVGSTADSPTIHVCAVVEPDSGTPDGGGTDSAIPETSIQDARNELPM